MPLFGLFGPPDVEKLKAKGDVEGLIKALNYEKDVSVRRAAAEALGQIGDSQSMITLVASLGHKYSDVQQSAMQVLIKSGNVAVEPLVMGLKYSDNKAFKAVIVQVLAQIGDGQAVESLMVALKDYDTKKAALDALIKLGNTVIEPLDATLKGEPDPWMWRTAAEILGKTGDARAIGPLARMLKDKDGTVREAAVEALGKIGDRQAVEPLLAALTDEYRVVQQAAIKVLGQIGDTRAVGPLVEVLADKDRIMREAARDALKKFGELSITPLSAALHSGDSEKRVQVVETLGQFKNAQTVEMLIKLLKDKDARVQEAAVRALGQIGDRQAVEPLLVILKDEKGTLRWVTAWVLGKIGDTRAVEPLIAALEDRVAREAATQALGQIGDARAVGPLVMVLKDGGKQEEVSALVTILGRTAKDITTDDLRAVTYLKDVVIIETRYNDCGFEMGEEPVTKVNYSQARQLARQELIRRGLEA